MNGEKTGAFNSNSILENITRTLLYEGYALYPYHRSAVKNQKPVPFGVVFPQDYHTCNEYAHSTTQTQCIITGDEGLLVNVTIRFLHLKKIELFENAGAQETGRDNLDPAYNLSAEGKSYQAGWQTIERTISSGDLEIVALVKNKKIIPIEFDEIHDDKYDYDESGKAAARQIDSVSGIKGIVIIGAACVENIKNAFRITTSIANITPVKNAETVTRDEVLSQSFLSTHTILNLRNGQFISHQNPDEKWKATIAGCENINTWPILIDESNTTMLSSPIIFDRGDVFACSISFACGYLFSMIYFICSTSSGLK